MPGPALPALIVSESERRELERLVKRPSTPQQLALRAQIILRASQGDSQGQIARELGIGEQMNRCWRRRWQALQTCELPVSERLADAPRPGAPPRLPWSKSLNSMPSHVPRPSTLDAPSVTGPSRVSR
ncbi:helix-turn-helix domain-containing protein [Leptothermofonsia sp. ETS-13]|uniref:helix-turn-helix domain-containing protein n=1 Tax=Leptothermofonsia sp. ETS-13 TaxID=3035696 RepID=UPI003B9FDED4